MADFFCPLPDCLYLSSSFSKIGSNLAALVGPKLCLSLQLIDTIHLNKLLKLATLLQRFAPQPLTWCALGALPLAICDWQEVQEVALDQTLGYFHLDTNLAHLSQSEFSPQSLALPPRLRSVLKHVFILHSGKLLKN